MNDDQKRNEQKKKILTPEKKPDSATKAVAIILLGVLILSLVIFPIIILINRSGINNAALDLTDNRKNILVYFSVFIMTIFAYLFFPVLYRLVNGKVDRKRATRIALFNSIVVAILFRLLEAVLNTDVAFNATTFAPAFFYFWIAKAILQQKSNEKTMKDKTTDLPPENATDFVDGTYSYRVAEIERREGAVAYFSPQEILIRIIDLLTAQDVLTEEDYKIVRIIYDHYRSLKEKKPLSFPDFLKLQNEMIAHFDLIGPYYLFSGSEPTKEAEAAESRKHGYRERAKKILASGYLFGSDWMRLHQAFYEAFYTPIPDEPSETALIKSANSPDSKLEAPQDFAALDGTNALPQENAVAVVDGSYSYRVAKIERGEGVAAYFSPREIIIRIVNLLTAFLASYTVKSFEDTIAKVVALSAIMTIVSGMGGNAGTQTMSILVRELSQKNLKFSDCIRPFLKEIALGVVNGAATGAVTAVVVYFMYGNAFLGMITLMAMIGNLVVAGVCGFLVPVVLKKIHADPAIASSIFVTTATDVLGFFIFLGLANVFLRYLI